MSKIEVEDQSQLKGTPLNLSIVPEGGYVAIDFGTMVSKLCLRPEDAKAMGQVLIAVATALIKKAN